MKYEFILRNDNKYPVEKMCKYMKVSKNSFYYWLKNKDVNKMKMSTVILKQRVTALFYENKQIYGSYRIQQMLKRENFFYSRSYLAVLMRELGLRSVLKRKFVITTNSNHDHLISKNLLNREFTSLKLG
jgi:hypothetical protein